MIILGIDCASKQSSVCIMENETVLYTAVQATKITHSQNLLPMIQAALTVCGLTPGAIELYAVTTGPGSFTGLRIGLALVKGMASAHNTPCIGVSSLQALAKSTGITGGIVIPAFDARRNQVYACVWEDGNLIAPDTCDDIGFLEKYIKTAQKNVFFVGDAKKLCYNRYGNLKQVMSNTLDMPCAAYGACLLAMQEYQHTGPQTHFQLSPSYLRLSQAERELQEKTEGKL